MILRIETDLKKRIYRKMLRLHTYNAKKTRDHKPIQNQNGLDNKSQEISIIKV